NLDVHPLGEVGLLAQVVDNRLPLELPLFKNTAVRLERDARSGHSLGRSAHLLQRTLRGSDFILLGVADPIAAHLGAQIRRERVPHRHTYTVQSSGNFVAVAAELTTGV